MGKYSLVISCVLVVTWYNIANALSCYECTSRQSNECHKDASNTKVQCENGVKQCFMEDILTEHGRHIARGCLDDPIISYCPTIKQFASLHYPIHKIYKCYTCKTDFCNSV